MLAILEAGCHCRFEVGLRVLLCFTYRFLMPRFFGREFCTLVRLVTLAIDFSGFQNCLRVVGVLKLGYLGDLLFCCQCFWGGDHSDRFPEFLDLPAYMKNRFLEEDRVVAKESHSLFGGLQLSTQAKRCEMRPHPASKKTEGEELD